MKKEEISIRRWSVDDWEVYRAIRLEALSAHADVFGASIEVEGTKDSSFWKDRLADIYNCAVFGLYDGGTVIGLTGVYRHRDQSDVAMFIMSYIRGEYRKNNLSDLLYRERLEWARAQGDIKAVRVGHREGNEASRRANQRWGFKLYSIEDHEFGNGDITKEYMYELIL